MRRPNSASCLWKSAYWIQRISDPRPAATTFSWTPPNATEWIRKSSRKPWQRNLQPNEIRKRRPKQTRGTVRQKHRPVQSSGGVRVCTPPLFWDRRPAQRCQRSTTLTVEASFLERTMVNEYVTLFRQTLRFAPSRLTLEPWISNPSLTAVSSDPCSEYRPDHVQHRPSG